MNVNLNRAPRGVLLQDLKLGTTLESPAAFSEIVDFLVDEDGAIYVLDQMAQEIRVFDSSGAFTHVIGRKGAGPGEFRAAFGLAWSPSNTLWIADFGNRRYSEFARDGTLLSTHSVSFTHSRPWATIGVDEAGGLYDEAYHSGRLFLRRLDFGAATADSTFLTDTAGAPGFFVGRGRASYSLPFGWRFVWRPDVKGYVWTARTDRYAIDRKAFSGDTVLTIVGDLPLLPVTAQERRQAIASLERVQRRFGDRTSLDYSRIPRVHPLIESFDVDDRGRLWVRPVSSDSTVRFHVFGADGRYLMKVEAPWQVWPVRPVRIRANAVYCVVKDSLGVSYVVRGRLEPRQ